MNRRHRYRNTDPVTYVLVGALAVVILCAAVLFFAFLKEKTAHAHPGTDDGRAEVLLATVSEQQAQMETYEQQLGEYQSIINTLEHRLESIQEENDRLTAEKAVLAEENQTGTAGLEALQTQLTEQAALLDYYKKLVSANHGYRSEQLTALFDLLEKDTPDVRRIFFDEDETVLAESTAPTAEGQKGNMSLYYRDLTTGYTIGYNETEVRYSASLVKAPYIYCILEEIAAFEAGKTPDADGGITYLPGEEKYDLTREWVYEESTMFKEGSGEIQNMGDGTVLTYRQLVEYALLYSDNIAFSELRKVFGTDAYYAKAGALGVKGSAHGFMQLSAEDCGKFLGAIYDFFETESPWAMLMKDCMTRSAHNVMIVSGLWGKTVAHKYGWDKNAYHDMAIVLEEKPYILVILSDLESGGEEVNDYIRSIVRLTDEIHREQK